MKDGKQYRGKTVAESSKNKVFIVMVMIFLVVCLFLYFARAILMPFLIAAFVAYLIFPLVLKIQSYGYRRWVGVAVIAVILAAVLAAFLIIFIPLLISEIEKFKVNYSDYYKCFSDYLDILRRKVEIAIPVIKSYNISDIIIERTRDFILSEVQKIPAYLMSVFSVFSIIVLIPMLVLFMLLGADKSINAALNFLPSKYIETLFSVIYKMDAILGKFIRGQIIEVFFVGGMSVIFLSAFGVNFALIIGIIAGFANMIPYLGPLVGLVLALTVGIIQFQTFAVAVKIVVVYAAIQFLDNNLVQPFVIGYNLNLGPVAMIFAILAGGQIFGLLGMVFAIPVMAVFKTIFIMLIQKYNSVEI
ncbi:MAG: AI-2E family transporter [Endomicrobium sp.]|jgi:predicted PurR-regulated permease PerM|nr:AI-2E family transporter [Endomicrobium sp.]